MSRHVHFLTIGTALAIFGLGFLLRAQAMAVSWEALLPADWISVSRATAVSYFQAIGVVLTALGLSAATFGIRQSVVAFRDHARSPDETPALFAS